MHVFCGDRESVCVHACVLRRGEDGEVWREGTGAEPKPETHANLCLLLLVMKGSVQDTRDTN